MEDYKIQEKSSVWITNPKEGKCISGVVLEILPEYYFVVDQNGNKEYYKKELIYPYDSRIDFAYRRISEIVYFIKRKFKGMDFYNCSYYFALILTTRFKDLKMYYLTNRNLFVVGEENIFYDWNGLYDITGDTVEDHKYRYVNDYEYKQMIQKNHII